MNFTHPRPAPVPVDRDCDLMADVPLPDGATSAGSWQLDTNGRPHRIVSVGASTVVQYANGDVAPGGPALPPGADPEGADDDWQPALDGFPSYRCVWSPPINSDLDIRAVVIQYADGRIETEGDDAPLVYIGADHYATDKARWIAQKLLEVADLADRWAGTVPVVEARLVQVRSVVESAYVALRTEPGNVGDYLRAALDSIADAQAVTR